MRAPLVILLLLCGTWVGTAHASETAAFGRKQPRPGPGPEAGPGSYGEGAHGDGVYGRFGGDFSFSIGAGLELDFAGPEASPRPLVLGTARFYQTAGIYAGLSQAVASSDRFERVLSTGIVLEPLFLYRWSGGHESGRAVFDLLVDSLSLSVGAYFAEPRSGQLADASGLELGLGLGLPLCGKAPGPWLRTRGQMRIGQSDPAALVHLVLEWQGFWESDLIHD